MNILKISKITSLLLFLATGGSYAAEMPDLARKLNCIACHDLEKLIVGPSWVSISRKYKNTKNFTYGDKDYPLLEGLMMKVSKGGSGNWSTTPYPMPANDAMGTKQDEIKELVTFILNLKN